MRQHPDPDVLALHAVGEPALTAYDLEHLSACRDCHATLAEFLGTALLLRGDDSERGAGTYNGVSPAPLTADIDSGPPPLHLWAGIAAELGLSPEVVPPGLAARAAGESEAEPVEFGTALNGSRPAVTARPELAALAKTTKRLDKPETIAGTETPEEAEPPPSTTKAPTMAAAPAGVPAPVEATPATEATPAPPAVAGHAAEAPATPALATRRSPVAGAQVLPLRPRRSARQRSRARLQVAVPLLGAAACGAVVSGLAVAAWQVGLPGTASESDAAVVAAADLAAFGDGAGSGAAGSARLLDGADGRELTLSVSDVPAPNAESGYLEAWLIDPDSGEMVSLGVVEGEAPGAAEVVLAVPAGLDVARYSVVDLSDEPFDGDPTHSGRSLVRGELGV